MTLMQLSYLHSNKLSHTLLQTTAAYKATLNPVIANHRLRIECYPPEYKTIFSYLTFKVFYESLY